MRGCLDAFLLIGVSMFLISCGDVNPVAFQGPNGLPAYSMKCSGMGRTMSDCYSAAGGLCPAGYSIIVQETGIIAVSLSNGRLLAAPQKNICDRMQRDC